MNYYNPYFGSMAYTPALGTVSNASSSKGLLSSLFGGGKFTSFINGTQKTLNIINQAIPLVKQVSPIVKNAKTMFKVMNEFKRVDSSEISKDSVNVSNSINNDQSEIISVDDNPNTELINTNYSNGPTFFLE